MAPMSAAPRTHTIPRAKQTSEAKGKGARDRPGGSSLNVVACFISVGRESEGAGEDAFTSRLQPHKWQKRASGEH